MTDASDRELVTSRVIRAPRARVFAAIVDPRRLARWWGPAGFTNTFHECDVRPGGRWRFTMHGPSGANFENESVFAEIAPARVVIGHVSPPVFDLEITLDERDGRTTVGWRQRFPTREDCEKVKRFAGDANEQNLDRLAAEVAAGA
jgi:uncharacterized protein YndB with AHSA1/START domain